MPHAESLLQIPKILQIESMKGHVCQSNLIILVESSEYNTVDG